MNRSERRSPVIRSIAFAAAVLCAATAFAQSRETGRLIVLVRDPSGAVIAGAAVIAARDGVDGPEARRTTEHDGTAIFDTLAAGRYVVTAEFDGFETTAVSGVRIGSGDNRRTITLPIRKMKEGLTVGRDPQDTALDPGGSAFSTILTRAQIDALPDDPDELEAVLKAMAPPGSTIRVDGFTGGRLPSKAQIRSIRLPRMDQFAAQNHGGMNGLTFIDIGTQPGGGALAGAIETSLRDDALNARNPFAPDKGDEQLREGTFSLAGPVVTGRSSFAIDAGGGRQIDTSTLLAALPGETESAGIRQTSAQSSIGGRFDQALGVNHTLRASFRTTSDSRHNLGVGGYNLPDRAFASASRESVFRLSENGPIGPRLFIDSRFETSWLSSDDRPTTEALAIQVLDAFTAGGAQRSGGRRAFRIEAATDVDFVRGAHSWRAGVLLESGRFRSDQRTNYLGTYTFSSLDAYQAGQPSLYTRRVGDPLVRYVNTQLGAYLQDDFRVARSLLISFGLRYEGQSVASDWWNLSPRGTITWAPSRSGKTTFRAAWGRFTDWLDAATHEQALRVDGVRQREISIPDPSYPSIEEGTGVLPPNRYVLGSDFALPTTHGWNVGVDQALTSSLRASATYTERTSSNLLRGINDNPLEDGVRVDPAFRDIIRASGDAGQRARLLHLNLGFTNPRWRRSFVAMNYTLGSVESNTAGPFSLPASGDLSLEWGETMPRHRFNVNASLRLRPNLSLSMNARAQSGVPYTITTGQDTNGDGQFSDRPMGVARNSARGRATWDVGGRLSYAVGFGGLARGNAGGGDQVVVRLGGAGGGELEGGYDGGAESSRYRVEIYVSAQNLTNHPNYTGYSGVVPSPFFGQPTNLMNPRKFELGLRFGF